MESILGKIFASAMMCAVTGEDPKAEAEKCANEIMQDLFGEKQSKETTQDLFGEKHAKEIIQEGEKKSKEALSNQAYTFASFIANAPMCIKAEHKADWGERGIELQIKGYPVAVRVGIVNLLEAAGTQIASRLHRDPSEVIREICEDAIRKVDQDGGVTDAQD